MQKKWNSNRQQ